MKFFSVPALDPGEAEQELNRFLRGHRVVSIERQLVSAAGRPVWCLAIEVLDDSAGAPVDGGLRKSRVDYKEILPPADFARFSKLRELRKQIGEEEGVPVYAVFTNEQLAAIAQRQPTSLAELQQVDGVGEGKAARYGARVLAVLKTLAPPPAAATAAGEGGAG